MGNFWGTINTRGSRSGFFSETVIQVWPLKGAEWRLEKTEFLLLSSPRETGVKRRVTGQSRPGARSFIGVGVEGTQKASGMLGGRKRNLWPWWAAAHTCGDEEESGEGDV